MFWVPNFIKIGAYFHFGTKFCKFVIVGQGHQLQLIFHKNWAIAILRPNLLHVLNFESRSAISNIFMINELDLLWLANFIALGIYFIFGTKFSGNEGIDTWFDVEGMQTSQLGRIDYCEILIIIAFKTPSF